MKIIHIDKYTVDIVAESEKYIDIYTYRELYHNHFCNGSRYLDYGKGWRLIKLIRTDRITKQEFEIECSPGIFSSGYDDYAFQFTYNNIEYSRTLCINQRKHKDYVTQDMISTVEDGTIPEKYQKSNLKKSPRFKRFISDNTRSFSCGTEEDGNIRVDYEKNTYHSFKSVREDDLNYIPLEEYINDFKTDTYSIPFLTNELFQAFNNMSKKLVLFGEPNEEITYYEHTDSPKKYVKNKNRIEYKI